MGDDLFPGTKRCPSCPPGAPPKPLEGFGRDKRRPDGHRAQCKDCVASAARDARAQRRANGVGPKPGKKVRARKQVVVSLDERRADGGKGTNGRARDGQPVTAQHWIPEHPGPDPDTTWYEAFLERLATHRTVTDAAAHVGIHPMSVWRALKRDPLFAEAYEYARKAAADRVEDVSWRRGVEGWHEPVVDRDGNVVTDTDGNVVTRHVYDAAMLRLILQGVAPEYRRGPSVAVQVNTQVNGTDVRQKLVSKIDEYASRSG